LAADWSIDGAVLAVGLRCAIQSIAYIGYITGLVHRGRRAARPPSRENETALVAATVALDPRRDWIAPGAGGIPALVAYGVPLVHLALDYSGDPNGGWWPGKVLALPLMRPGDGRLTHAVGVAHGLMQEGKRGVVLAVVGPGARSTEDAEEAARMAASRAMPVVFFALDGEPATVALRRVLDSRIAVDGHDFCAVYGTVRSVVEACRSGAGPYLVEALPPSGHPDDGLQDPLDRLERAAIAAGAWSEDETAEVRATAQRRVEEAFTLVQELRRDHIFVTIPDTMARRLGRDRFSVGIEL
jgi:pyruvate dehydrogenase E1 component alpha subunit